MKHSNRLVLYAKDVMLITGRSRRAVTAVMAKVRKQYSRPPSIHVSIADFCGYMGIAEEKVREMLS